MSAVADIFAAVRLAIDGTGFEAQATALATKAGQNAGTQMSQQLSSKLKSAVVGAIGTAAGAAFGMALTGANELDAATRQLQADTGMTAEEAKNAEHALAGMYKNNLQGFDEIGATMAVVRTGLGLTGDAADAMTEKFLKFGTATNQNAAAAANAFADILHAFNLTADQTPIIMDKLVASHQKYNTVVTESQSALVKMAPAMVAANMTIDDGIALLNAFQVAGIDAAKAPTALAAAVKKLKPGQDLNDLIAQISAIPDPTLRAQKAMEIFGGKSVGWAKVFASEGVTLSDYNTTVAENANAMTDAAAVIEEGFGNRLKLTMKNAEGTLAEFGTGFGDLIGIAQLFGPKFTTAVMAGLGGLGSLLIKQFGTAVLGATVPTVAAGEALGVATGAAAGTAVPGAFAAAAALAFPALVAGLVALLGVEIALGIDKLAPGLAKKVHDQFFAGVEVAAEDAGKIGDFFAPVTEKAGQLADGIIALHDAITNLGVPAAAATKDVTAFGDASLGAARYAGQFADASVTVGAAAEAAGYKVGTFALEWSAATVASGIAFRAMAAKAAENYVSVGGAAEAAGYKVGTAAFDMSTAAATAAGKIYTSMSDIGTSFTSAASALISAGNAAIGGAYDPLINKAELVAARLKLADDTIAASATTLTATQKRTLEVRILDEEAHLAKLKKAHASYNTIAAAEEAIAADKKKLSAKGVTTAELAQLNIQLLNDRKHIAALEFQELTAGTKAQQAAKINGYLTGAAHAAGLNSSNPQEAEAAATLDTTLRAVLAKLTGDAGGYGTGAGTAYGTSYASAAYAAAMSSPAFRALALGLPTGNTPAPKPAPQPGQTGRTPPAPKPAPSGGGLRGALAGGGPVTAGMPYIVGDAGRPELFVPDVSGRVLSSVPAGFSGGGGPTYNVTVNNPEPRAAGPDIGRVLRRTAALGMA